MRFSCNETELTEDCRSLVTHPKCMQIAESFEALSLLLHRGSSESQGFYVEILEIWKGSLGLRPMICPS
jgi:hypothetical protein